MSRMKSFDWGYLILAESTDTRSACRLERLCKTAIWLGLSILMGVGVGQLS